MASEDAPPELTALEAAWASACALPDAVLMAAACEMASVSLRLEASAMAEAAAAVSPRAIAAVCGEWVPPRHQRVSSLLDHHLNIHAMACADALASCKRRHCTSGDVTRSTQAMQSSSVRMAITPICCHNSASTMCITLGNT